MQQINPNIVTVNPNEDPQYNNLLDACVKIYLSGTVAFSEQGDWQTKFVNAFKRVTEGDDRFKGIKFCIICPKCPTQNPAHSVDNPEYVNKIKWELDMMSRADVVFCNFLKRSKVPRAMSGFLQMSTQGQGKLIVRCPQEYVSYAYIKVVSETLGIPLLEDNGTVADVLELMWQNCPKIQTLINAGLGNE